MKAVRAKSIVATLFVLSLVIAAVVVTRMMSQQGGATVSKTQVLVATLPLPQGTLLREQDVTWQPVAETQPGEVVRPTASAMESDPELDGRTKASVYGAVLRHDLPAGEPIRSAAIVKPGERDFLQVVLVPGKRAISIPVATGGASTGLLSAGDNVDVIVTQNFKNDNVANQPLTRRSVSETVVEGLRVLAIDAPADVKSATAGVANAAPFGRTVTLEVTPEQAEQVNVATELGKLSLTLRSATDYASASPASPTFLKAVARPVDGHVRPTWAGDVSPALTGAVEKPVVTEPQTVTILRGFKPQGGKERAEPEIVKLN